MVINFAKIEKKWQDKWEKAKIFNVNENSKKKKYYVLEMFPYPSASGLHMGHALNYAIGDVIARFKRMNGFEVLYPMGFDALGLPAENAAIEAGEHPKPFTEKAIKNYTRQMKDLGLSYDWTRTLATMYPEYYKWNQYFFLKFLGTGLIYRKKAPINWCPSCNTVISNEQAQGGICERCKSKIEIKRLDEWYLKTTEYADELLDGLEGLDWPDKIKAMQRNWIGKSHGIEIDFEINGVKWPIFTTRPDTIFGVTFMVVSAQHEKLMDLVTKEQREDVEKFLKSLGSVSEKEIAELEKRGVFTGSYAINPVNGEKIPVYAGNFVVADYGSGMIMAVPAHDQRDMDFVWEMINRGNDIKIKFVIFPEKVADLKDKGFTSTNPNFDEDEELKKKLETLRINILEDPKSNYNNYKAYTGNGKLMNSDKFNNLNNIEAKKKINSWLIKKKFGRKVVNYKLRDWGFSRQRYWGTPIPIIHCEKCGAENIKTKLTLEFHGEYRFNSIINGGKTIETRVFDTSERKNLGKEDLVTLEHKGERVKRIAKVTEVFAFKNLKDLFDNGKNLLKDIFPNEKIESLNELVETYNSVSEGYVNKINRFGLGAWRIELLDISKIISVPEKDLPVVLPEKVKFGEGNPLTTNEEWINVKCPRCGGAGKRETETMDTFFDSSWYFLRYTDNKNDKRPFDKKKIKKWLPVDQYIGGAEHACMHLIYARFFTKALRDLKFLDFDEPFKALFNQGMLHGPDGEKMSKSKGNVINPDEVSKKYGMDSARYFLLSLAAPDKPRDWSDKGIQGSLRFIRKIFSIFENIKVGKSSDDFISKLNSIIKDVTEFYGSFQYRKATIKLKELFDLLSEQKEVSKEDFGISLKLLNPICPHVTEELWEKLGNKDFISVSGWPKVDNLRIKKKEKKVDLNLKIIEDVKYVLGKVNGKIVYLYVMPFELGKVDVEKIVKTVRKKVKVFAVNDSKKYDPEGKAKKAKPGKAGIYLE